MSSSFILRRRASWALMLTLTMVAVLALPGPLSLPLEAASASQLTSKNSERIGSAEHGPQSPGAISFSAPSFIVNEDGGAAIFTLTRTGGTDGAVTAKVYLNDVTTSPADYRFAPGAVDSAYLPNPRGFVHSNALTFQPDGKLLVSSSGGLRRFNTDGSTDATFTELSVDNAVAASVVQPDGKIIIAGSFRTVNLIRRNTVARLNADGTLDSSFDIGLGPENIGYLNAVALQPDGKIIIAGFFYSINGQPREGVARLNADGSLDNTFVSSGGNVAYALALQPDGKILVGRGVGVLRFNTDGTVDNTFQPPSDARPVLGIAVQADGRIIIAGSFNTVHGVIKYNVARLNTDGSLDANYNSGSGPNSVVDAVTFQPDGKLLIAGAFQSFNGVAAQTVARLDTDGNIDPSFNSGMAAGSRAESIALQPDGKIILGGFVSGRFLVRLQNDLFVTWAAGDATDKTVSLPIVDDLLDEPDERLNLGVDPLTGGATVGAHQYSALAILDNDVPPAFTSPLPPPVGTIGNFYSHTFTASGSLPSSFSAPSGSLPTGLSLSSAGTLSGTPTTAGTYNVTVTANNGVAPAATQSFSIRIQSRPVTGANSFSVNEDSILTVAAPGLLGNDSDPDNDALSVITQDGPPGGLLIPPMRGTLSLNADGSFSYTPNANFSGTDSFSYRAFDGYSYSNLTPVTITVNAVNDAPDNSVPGPQTVVQDNSLTFSGAQGNGIAAGDLDAGAGQVKVTLSATNGTVSLNGTFGLTFLAGTGTNDATMTFTGSLSTINSRLNGMRFNPAPGFIGAASLQLVTDDQGNTGTGGALTDTDTVNITVQSGGTLQFSEATLSADEGSITATVTVTRAGGSVGNASVNYATSNGTASAVSDYTTAVGTLQFAPGVISKTFTVLITDDAYIENSETINLTLSNPLGAMAGGANTLVLTITDNDTVTPTLNPIDEAQFFIRQNYADFLSREPDPGGLSYWTERITQCGTNISCINFWRSAVSAAFFIELEFQSTGSFVYRVFKASYGQRPTYEQFTPDRARLVDTANLNQNKTNYTQLFVQRPEFIARYPLALSGPAFVDALLQTVQQFSQVNLTGQRNLLIATYDAAGGGHSGRAAVLRAVAENSALAQAEYNKAFVLMQYFGYLKREPDEGGYQFWLNVVNNSVPNDPSGYRSMVCAFITSREYQERFSPAVTRNDTVCAPQ